MIQAVPRPRVLAGAVVAGLIAGATIAACLTVLSLALGVEGFSLRGLFAFDASVLVGKAAYSSPAYVGLGVLLHFCVAIGWAVGYAFAAGREHQLIDRPLISGAAFGFIIYFAMQLVIVAANLYRIPTPSELGIALVAHMVGYGMPVALIVSRSARRR